MTLVIVKEWQEHGQDDLISEEHNEQLI